MNSIKSIIKMLFPQELWFLIRKWLIVRKHKEVAAYCDALIKRVDIAQPFFLPPKNKELNEKIIWQYWGQGYDNVPELVKICLDSVEKHKGDCMLIRLTDENLSDYIDLPSFVQKKRLLFSSAFFADLLRLLLLQQYGGVWLDATVLLTGNIPQRYFDMDFFVFQRDANEIEVSYWEHAYAYYYGWYKGFKVNMLNSIFFAKKGIPIISELTKLMLSFWKDETKLPDYFFMQILFGQLIKNTDYHNCPIESDCIPHILQQIINADYKSFSVDAALGMTSMHKLSYKTHEAVERLKQICKEYNL